MLSCVLFYSALHGGSGQGCQNAYKSRLPSVAIFFYFIYVILDVIATCIQNFKKVDRKKPTKLFSIENLLHSFCARLYVYFFKDNRK